MDSEEDAQARIDRHHAEQRAKLQAERFREYLERVRIYSEARMAGKWPMEFQAAAAQ